MDTCARLGGKLPQSRRRELRRAKDNSWNMSFDYITEQSDLDYSRGIKRNFVKNLWVL